VQLAPDDAYIQDSLGWVEFRLGRPAASAQDRSRPPSSKRPDAEIAAHLGEVLWSLGEREGALRVWREGQRLDADNETLKKTLQALFGMPAVRRAASLRLAGLLLLLI
jgi:hypothetical protein